MSEMNIIIITGASSGIGIEFARQIDRYFKKTVPEEDAKSNFQSSQRIGKLNLRYF